MERPSAWRNDGGDMLRKRATKTRLTRERGEKVRAIIKKRNRKTGSMRWKVKSTTKGQAEKLRPGGTKLSGKGGLKKFRGCPHGPGRLRGEEGTRRRQAPCRRQSREPDGRALITQPRKKGLRGGGDLCEGIKKGEVRQV